MEIKLDTPDILARLESRLQKAAERKTETLRRDLWDAAAVVLIRHGLPSARDPGGYETQWDALRLFAPGVESDTAHDRIAEQFRARLREEIAAAIFDTATNNARV